MTPPILQFDRVGFRRHRRGHSIDILHDVTLSLAARESLAVMGPSGIGKTTLCRLAAGLARPDRGAVLFRGERLKSPSHEITVSFQNYPCFPWLTVQENARFGLRADTTRTDGEQREYADWLIGRLGLGHVRDAYPRELSGGMQQRLSFARSLAVRPEVLILDEPFSALDAATKDQLKDLLDHLRLEMGFTLLVVLHDLVDAYDVAERAIVLGGRPASIVGDFKTRGASFDVFKQEVLGANRGDADVTHLRTI